MRSIYPVLQGPLTRPGCCITVFDVIVGPKRTNGFKWTVNIDDATLDGLKEYIREEYNPATLENDGAV